MKPNMARGERKLMCVALGWLGFLLSTGCVSERKENETEVEKNQSLTAEMAKRALLEMDPGQIPPGVLVPRPKDEPIRLINDNEIAVGGWNCNLKERAFHITHEFPEAARHQLNSVRGIFQRTQDGKWRAKVTDSSSGG